MENFRKLNVSRRGEPDKLEKSRHALTAVGCCEAKKSCVIIEEFARRQVVIEIRLLGKVADFAVHGDVVNRFAANTRRSRRRKNQTHEQLQRGGLAGAIGAEKSKDFAVFDAQGKVVERAAHSLAPEARRVVLRQAVNFDCRAGHSSHYYYFFLDD